MLVESLHAPYANEELAAQLIPEGAQEALNTLTEIAQWIQDHPNDASAMNTAITKLNGIVAGIGGDEDTYATVMAAIEGKIAAAMKDITAGATKVEKSGSTATSRSMVRRPWSTPTLPLRLSVLALRRSVRTTRVMWFLEMM